MAEQALSDVKVLDLSWYIAGPYCSKLFGDYGADVIKIERPPAGDPARQMGPFFKDDPHPEKSGLFLSLNTNKKGITLNLKSSLGKEIFKELVKDVDILVESFSPGVMEKLGLSYEVLEEINPKLVMTSISNFGQTGPYRDYKATEIVLKAMAADMHSCGKVGREPLKIGGTLTQFTGGSGAATATMMGFFASRYQGIGQHLDICIYDSYAYCGVNTYSYLTGHSYDGSVTGRGSGGMGYPGGPQPCKDGFFDLAGTLFWFPRVLEMIDRPDLAGKYGTLEGQLNADLKDEFLATVLYPYFLERTKKELMLEAQKAKILSGPVNTMDDVLADPHFNDRGVFVEIEHPVTGKLTYPGAPVKMTETPWQMRSPAPLLGQHNEDILGELGYTKEDLVKLKEQNVI